VSAHTPGPWLHDHREGDNGYFNTEVFSPNDSWGVIATLAWVPQPLGNGVTGTYREANARLIAAAPDLLSALQGLDEAYCRAGLPLSRSERHEDRTRLIAARAAIAKATGEAA